MGSGTSQIRARIMTRRSNASSQNGICDLSMVYIITGCFVVNGLPVSL